MSGRGRSIVLIGMMGAGKSSVGRCLQQRTGLIRFDTDEIVAAEFGLAIPEIFAKHGEEKFRDAETKAVNGLPRKEAVIVVTGGGTLLRERNVERLKEIGLIAWLEASEETLFERASRQRDRPLLQTEDPRATLSELLRLRAPFYAKAADIRVDTTRLTHDEVADVILEEIENRISTPA